MRPVSIVHIFCGDAENSSLVYARADLTPEQIETDIKDAQTRYLDYMRSLAESPEKVTAPMRPDYEAHPNKLVSEVQTEWEALKERADAWKAHQQALRKPFRSFLFDNERYFESDPAELEIDLDWGHRHGWADVM